MVSAKTNYLAVYDYGMGGVWAVISAPSKEAILSKYPVLEIVAERPTWMQPHLYEEIARRSSFDLDDPPPDWIKAGMKESNRL
jgi:hypothetical protein